MSQSQSQFLNDRDYYVVEFYNEVTNGQMAMSVVPYTWLNIDTNNRVTCLWPSFKKDREFNIAVRNKDEPILKNCKKCDVNVKYKTNSYENAIAKLKRLEIESGLSTSPSSEDEHRPRRHIFKNSRYAADVSDDELPTVPKPFKVRNETVEKDDSRIKNTRMQKSSAEVGEIGDVTLVPEPVYTFQQMQEKIQHIEDLVKKLMTKMDILSSDLKYTTMLIQNPKEKEKEYKESEIINGLPVTSVESLTALETKLQDTEIFTEMCMSSLTVIGGRDMKETVRRLLAKIVSHTVALAINWSGKHEKLAFKNCENTVKLILAITRKNPLCKNVTCQEVESVIKVWLRSAGDRMGGRDKRRVQ